VLLTAALLAVVAGSIVYSVLTIVAARDYLAAVARAPGLPRRDSSRRMCMESSDVHGHAPRQVSARQPGVAAPPPISVLKPLSGAEDHLEPNLRTFFQQEYQPYEILFAVRHSTDPAVAVVKKLQS